MPVGENAYFVGENQDRQGTAMGQKQDGTEVAERTGEDFASERGWDFDAKREAYEAAQGKLLDLIDGPTCTASVSEYRRELKSALQAQQRAHKAMMAAWA